MNKPTGSEKVDTFESLRVPNFRKFFVGQLISQIGNRLTLVAQSLLVLRITNSGIALGLLAAAQFGPVLLFASYAGLLADRSNKRKMLIAVQTFAMFQSFALGAIAFMDRPKLWMIFAVALAGGFGTAFDNPTRRSFVVELVPTELISNAASLNTTVMTGARVVGPALGGLLVSTVGFGWTFLIDGLTYLAVIGGLMRMDPAQIRPTVRAQQGRGQIRAGFRYAWGEPRLRVPLVIMAAVGTFAFNFSTVFPLFTTRVLNGPEVSYTWLMSVLSIGSVLGALASARRSDITVKFVAQTSLMFGGSFALLLLSPNLFVALPLGVLVGYASVTFMTASTVIVQVVAEPTMRARVLALQAMVFLGSTPIGGPIVGTISEKFGARYGLAVGAIACLGAGVWGLGQTRQTRVSRPLAQ